MRSRARTPEAYLAYVPAERQQLIRALRLTILENLDDSLHEIMAFGAIAYTVPLARYPLTYDGKPLRAFALSDHQDFSAVDLTGIHEDEGKLQWFVDTWTATGTRLDMDDTILRFSKLEDVAFEVLGQVVAAVTADDLVAAHEAKYGPI